MYGQHGVLSEADSMAEAEVKVMMQVAVACPTGVEGEGGGGLIPTAVQTLLPPLALLE